MASIDVQHIHALRNNIRNVSVPAAVSKLIDSIHQSLRVGAMPNAGGWRTAGKAPPRYAPPQTSYVPKTVHARSIPATSRPDSPASGTSTPPAERRGGAWHDNGDGFRGPPPKYVSKFKKSENVEDTILNTILLGKLNKFSPSNYNEIKEFITHIIDNGQTDMIKCFMKIVFEKAASEEVFCPLYAKLLSELSEPYPVLLTEMASLYEQYMEIFEEVVDHSTETYNEMCKRNVEKKYRRGYSQFLAELIKNNIMDTAVFIKIIDTIVRYVEIHQAQKESVPLMEEFADCLMKIMKAIRAEDDDDESKIHEIRAMMKKDMMHRIQPLSVRDAERVGISSKARFTFLDIYEGIQKL